MYTCLYETMIYGGTCIDPMFFHFPTDENLFKNYEESFMVGGALKVSPVLNPGVKDTFPAYFPEGKWVSMTNFSEIIEGPIATNLSALTPTMTVQVHLRPGSIIPF